MSGTLMEAVVIAGCVVLAVAVGAMLMQLQGYMLERHLQNLARKERAREDQIPT